MNSIYEFNSDDAIRFANNRGSRTRIIGKEMQFQFCPYCMGGKSKDKWTFSININDGRFSCQRSSCGAKGNMITLARDFGYQLSEDVNRYYNVNNYNAGRFRKFKQAHIESKEYAVEYLASRGISEAVCRKYEVTAKEDADNILIFPFKDENSELRFIKYRNTTYQKGQDGSKEWCEKDCMPILFGMNHCNLDNKTLIITEGQIDSLTVAECGYENAVSVPTGMNGFTWVPHCWDWVHQFEKIIVFGDYERGNISLLEEIKRRFNLQIFHVRESDYRDCKDANDIYRKYGKAAIRDCIDNAVPIPAKHIISLASVDDVDVFNSPKLRTGFDKLDKMLYGGLPFGGVTLVAGKPGEGKSTCASQMLISAIETGHKCFVYSGELPNHMFKAWMNYQIAGPNHVRKYSDSWGEERYVVDKSDSIRMGEWYGDKCFIYDSNSIDGDEQESLINTIETAIQQYGTDVILIDNLMTALDLEVSQTSDKYEKQSLFVKQLTRLALKYKILVILVAHKRKNNFSGNENDEISGSGDISNLAMITMVYERSREVADEQRLLKISKNRLFGRLNTTGWTLNYDASSKRIYENDSELNREYGWVNNNGFCKIDEGLQSELPFDD